MALLALAMVSSFPYAKLARLLRLPPWLLVLPVVGALVDYGSRSRVVVLAYLVSGPLLWLRHRAPPDSLTRSGPLRGRRSRAPDFASPPWIGVSASGR